jgi:hypothetical protein
MERVADFSQEALERCRQYLRLLARRRCRMRAMASCDAIPIPPSSVSASHSAPSLRGSSLWTRRICIFSWSVDAPCFVGTTSGGWVGLVPTPCKK